MQNPYIPIPVEIIKIVTEVETKDIKTFRFAFLSRQRKQLERQSGLLAKLFEAFLEGDDDEPAFPLLPRV